jgi:hypothetical protein
VNDFTRQVTVPGVATLQVAVLGDPLDPPSTGPLLELELLVTTEKVDVSLGTTVINTTYYLDQAREDAKGQSPRFTLTVSTALDYIKTCFMVIQLAGSDRLHD